MNRTRTEYGGFLPLELNEGREFYLYDETQMQRFNCGKAAVASVMQCIAPKTIYIPYYLCPNVCKEIESHNLKVEYYHIDEKMMPVDLPDEEGDCVYLVNYFGIMDVAITQYARSFQKAFVILDNSHSFYCKPIMSKNIYNIYSCKKFFGVPDGAYLISAHLEGGEIAEGYASERALYLFESLEQGTNYCYTKKKEADFEIARNYEGMSVLTKRILQSIDYEAVKKKRCDNFRQYEEAFAEMNLFECAENSVPYIYPLNVGRNIKKQLVEKKIYVPTLWGHMIEEKFKGSLEYRLSDETIFLPLDQRYYYNDIEYIIETVKYILTETGSSKMKRWV